MEELPCSQELVEAGGPELDTVVTFANVVAEASEQGDSGVEGFLEALDAGEHGPGWIAREAAEGDAVQVLTAHGTVGQEFDTVLVAGTTEGNFPSLSRPEPMFDLAALQRVRSRSEQVRERLEDERRLFRMMVGRARRRVVLVAADVHPDADELTPRSRFVDELGVAWAAAPEDTDDDPVSVREAIAAWRRQLADPGIDAWRRLAALRGLDALGADPSTWWYQRDWSNSGKPLRDTLRMSYSRLSNLENCELQHVLGDELGLGRVAGYQAWVGKLVHGIIERIERGELGKTKQEILDEVDRKWREQEFPSKAVSVAHRKLVEERMFKNWWFEYGEEDSLGNEVRFDFDFEGTTIVGVIDRIGPMPGGGTRITDFKTGNPDNAPKAEESLQLGIYYLAVKESDDLAEYRPVRQVELAFIKGTWKGDHPLVKPTWQITPDDEEAYQGSVREALAWLIAKKRELNVTERYRPNPTANCFWCDFKSLCPLFPEGQPVFDEAAAMSTRVAPAEITAALGAEPTDEQWAAISWPLEPCVLIAGAGSGKTSVMAARVVYLALGALGHVDAPGVMPGNVLCLTFTNKATENLRLRVRRSLAHLDLAEGEEPEIMNYHGFSASLLDRYGVLAGFEPGARVLNQAQREELCGRVLDRMTFDHAAATYQPSLVNKILDLGRSSCRTTVSRPPKRSRGCTTGSRS